jgi:two-component system chemotaxis response regulator CheB
VYFVVNHIGGNQSRLPEILEAAGPLPAAFATDGETIVPRRICIAPPDYHLLLGRTTMALVRGPRENWSRPAIDPLFRSAARTFGPRVIGVLMTGLLNDGTAGLYEIGRHRGITIVQDPGEAEWPDMPASAFKHVAVDHCVPLDSIAPLLSTLARAIAKREEPFGAA